MSAIEVAVLLFCVAGIPGAGTSGIMLTVEAWQMFGKPNAAFFLCLISCISCAVLTVVRIVIWLRLRKAFFSPSSLNLGDDYHTLSAGVFQEGNNDFPEASEIVPEAPEALPEAPEMYPKMDEEAVTVKKSKKSKKHRKKTVKSHSPPPTEDSV